VFTYTCGVTVELSGRADSHVSSPARQGLSLLASPSLTPTIPNAASPGPYPLFEHCGQEMSAPNDPPPGSAVAAQAGTAPTRVTAPTDTAAQIFALIRSVPFT
jgi:hypothetical protein